MKARDKNAVRRLALLTGAKAQMGGQPVNASRTAAAYMPRLGKKQPSNTNSTGGPPPSAVPVETPAQPVRDSANSLVPAAVAMPPELVEAVQSIDRAASASFMAQDKQAEVLQALRDLMAASQAGQAQQPQGPKRPSRWVFSVKRDMRGLMESIEARPVYD